MKLARGLAATVVVMLACASPALAHTYGGTTARDGKIGFRLSADGARFISFRAERELSCRKGRVRSFRRGTFRQVTPFVRLGGGVFRGSARVRGPRGSRVRRGRFSIRAQVSELVARGVFRERVRLRDGTRCTSGRVRFRISLIDTNDG